MSLDLSANPDAQGDTLPVRVVVLVSEQLMPTLAFVLHAAQRWGRRLDSVHIYCTDDQRRSAEPAQRLQQVILDWTRTRGLSVTVDITVGGMQPGHVRKGLLEWFNAYEDSHWLVNVTGGNKLMSAAAIELCLASDLPACRVMYKEITGPWMQLTLDPASNLLQTQALDAATDADVPPPDALDTLLPLADLVAVQFSSIHRPSTQAVHPLPLLAILDGVQRSGWNWLQGYKGQVSTDAKLPVPIPTGSGDGFERFIAAGLQSCGVRVRHSLKLVDTVGSHKPMREIDVVAYHGGKLVCIDIKLPGAADTAKGTQLADIAELTKSLGGPAALAIALRPGWTENAEISRLAEVLNVRLLTQAHAPRVFTEMLGRIDPGLRISPEVEAVESRLKDWAAQGHAVLSDSRHLSPHAINDLGVLSVSNLVKDMAVRQQRCWVLCQLPGHRTLVWIDKKSLHGPQWTDAHEFELPRELGRLGYWSTWSNSAVTLCAILRLSSGVKIHDVQLRLSQLLNSGSVNPPLGT